MIAVLVNRIEELKPHQTTARLIEAGAALGHEVAILDVLSIAVRSPTEVFARCVTAAAGATVADACVAAQESPRVEFDLAGADLLLIRTSPGRDTERAWAHQLALQAARLVRDLGVEVANDPIGLERASSKLYGACLPGDLTPRTLVTHAPESVAAFVTELEGPAVIKPLLGSRGRDVFFVSDNRNLAQLCRLLGRTGYIVTQEYLPEANRGDVRVLVLDGQVLASDGGAHAAVRRRPRAGEFRSNVALGAEVAPAELTPVQLDICHRVASILVDDGIRFAGLDLVGDRVVEVNVFSTGGLVDAEAFAGADFATPLISALIRPTSAASERP